MRVISAILGLVLLCCSQTAMSAGVAGKVIVSRQFLNTLAEEKKQRETAAKAFYWNEPNGIAPVRPFRLNPASDIGMVLVRKAAPAGSPEKLTTVKVRAGGMEPTVLITRPGSTIRFRNVDPFEHELFVADMNSFQPELQSKGQFRHVEFPGEGVFEVRCKIMPHFRAYVVVVPTGLKVKIGTSGEFSSGNLEPGDYQLKVFYNGDWIHTQSVTIPEGLKKDLKLDVRLGEKKAPSDKPDKNEKKKG